MSDTRVVSEDTPYGTVLWRVVDGGFQWKYEVNMNFWESASGVIPGGYICPSRVRLLADLLVNQRVAR